MAEHDFQTEYTKEELEQYEAILKRGLEHEREIGEDEIGEDEIGEWHVGDDADVGHGPWDLDNHPLVVGKAKFTAPIKTPRYLPILKQPQKPTPKRHRKTSTENDELKQAYIDVDSHMNTIDIQKMEPRVKQNILGLLLSELHVRSNIIPTIDALKITDTHGDGKYIQKINLPVSENTLSDSETKTKLIQLYNTFISNEGKSDKSWVDLLAWVRKWAELLSDEKEKKGSDEKEKKGSDEKEKKGSDEKEKKGGKSRRRHRKTKRKPYSRRRR